MGLCSPGLLFQILLDHWSRVKPLVLARLPDPVASAAETAIEKALRCRTDELGFAQYRCADCGAKHKVHFSCKSRFCPSCGIARAQEAAANAQGRLLNVAHRHLTFSVPAELRTLLYERRELLAVVARAAAMTTIRAIGTRCCKYPPLPGVMATVHTFGRDLNFHVHVHVLCTAGGLRADKVWQPVKLYPPQQYRRLWQYYLLTLLRKKLKGDRSAQWRIGRLFNKYPTGFIANVMSQYRNGKQAAAYCCRYTGRPPLSEKRIVAYDGQKVTLAYQDYRDGQDKTIELTAEEFLFRLLQHVWPRYQRDVHYYGLYQPARRKHNVTKVAEASRYKDQVRPVAPLSRRERLIQALAGIELRCPECGGQLLFDYLQLPSKQHAKTRAGPTAKVSPQLALSM
jgi:DNA-directed RNA polymerase subunit RPC12/RpoP